MAEQENRMGLPYPIWINGPKQIDITTNDFYHLSWMGLASLWCHWKVLFHKTKDGGIKLYTSKCEIFEICEKNKRFEGIEWYEIPAAEMYTCTIPKEHKLVDIVEKKFEHLIMEGFGDEEE